jgi:protein-S-isoprenylcysteine O-methyltransferase Ste14
MLKRFLTPPIIFLLSLIVALVVTFYLPLYRVNNAIYQKLGWFLVLVGIILDFWAIQEFRKARTPLAENQKPATLVKSGPYAHSRNAIYLGYVLILVGFAAVAQSVTAFIGPIVLFLALNFITIPDEEQILSDEFGAEYLSYKEKVGRWFGTGR